MLKKLSVILFVMLAVVLNVNSSYSKNEASGVPKVNATANKKSYAPGESGYITLHFKTSGHVKIPKDPPVMITLNGASNDGMEDYSSESGDYINSNKVKVKFTVPSDASSGSKIKISGFVKFGYCSTDDGTCRLAKKDYSLNIKIK
ncbi:hypothetical protein BH10BAC5_BH10BAC5_22070 [soil metagenome]